MPVDFIGILPFVKRKKQIFSVFYIVLDYTMERKKVNRKMEIIKEKGNKI